MINKAVLLILLLLFGGLIILFVPIPSIFRESAQCQPCAPGLLPSQCPKCPQKGDIEWRPSIAKMYWNRLFRYVPMGERVQTATPANWETYSDNEVGYSVKYPNEWFKIPGKIYPPSACPNQKTFQNKDCMDGYITFKVFQKQSNQSLKEAIQERDKSINRDSPQFYQINLSQYLIDMGAILANYLGAYGPLSVYIPINQVINSSYLEISSFALDSDIFYKILSTFKFVEQGNAFCGGIAGTLCPSGYTCQLEGNYPDASGKCIPLR